MDKKLVVLQDGFKECGAATLLSIIRYYKGNYSMDKLLDLTKTSKSGTSFYNLKKAAQDIGFKVTAYKIDSLERLHNIKLPIICHIIEKNYGHFVVIYKVNKNNIIVMDPAYGKRTIKKEDLKKLWTSNILTLTPIKKIHYQNNTNYINKLIIKIILLNKKVISRIILQSIIYVISTVTFSLYIQVIIDNNINSNKKSITIITLIYVFILLIKCLANYYRNKLLIKLNKKIDNTLILNTLDKILLLPYDYYKNKTTGDMISRINDIAYIKNIINSIILSLFLDLLIIISTIIILIKYNYKICIIIIIIISFYILIMKIFRPLYKKLIYKNLENNSIINTNLVETINSYETVKNLHIEKTIYHNIEKIYEKALKDNQKLENMNNIEKLLYNLLNYTAILIINFLEILLLIKNKTTLGNIVSFNSLFLYFLDPIQNIINISKEYYFAKNTINRINNMFEAENEEFNNSDYRKLKGKIRIKKLTFSYDRQEVLKDISILIIQKSKVLITGKSGSGKTTLFKILYKYYHPKNKEIFIDNHDINDLSLETIRRNITYISQNENLFTDSVKNNITLNRNISEEKFKQVCKSLYLDEFVSKMYLGYETKIEENGLNLSGGQRQRIILARALLKESSIILIDEALSQVDINLERKIIKNIFKIYKEKTILVISHRLENLDLYDRLLIIENHSIVEDASRV